MEVLVFVRWCTGSFRNFKVTSCSWLYSCLCTCWIYDSCAFHIFRKNESCLPTKMSPKKYDWGWPKNGPFWTKNGQTWQACQRSKVVQRGPKGTKMVNLSLFEHLGPFWAHLDPFGPFQTRIDILLWSTSAKPYFVHLGQKKSFLSEMVQKGPDWPKRDPNFILRIFMGGTSKKTPCTFIYSILKDRSAFMIIVCPASRRHE